MAVKRLIILGSVLLLVSMGIFSSGCLHDEEDEAGVDCAETLCIGTLLAEGEGFNAPLIEAVDLAKDDINKAGGNIEIISEASFQAGAGEAVASARKLLEMGVHGIVGPSYSSDSVDVHSFLSENQLVGISPSATSPTLTNRNKSVVDAGDQPFFFRVSPSDLFLASILAKQTQGNTVIVNRNDAWGNPLATHVREEIMSDGRQVEVVSYDTANFRDDADDAMLSESAAALVSDVEAAVQKIPDVESIVLFVFNREGGRIIRGLLDSSVIPEVGYYTGDGLGIKDNLFPHVEEENGEIEGFKQVISTPTPDKRLEEFESRFDSGDFATHAYDAVVILSLAALSAGSNNPSDYVSKIQEVTRDGAKCYSYATCAAALTDETTINDDIDYEGLSGPIDLDQNGDITNGLYAVDTYDAQGVAQRKYLNFQGEEANTN